MADKPKDKGGKKPAGGGMKSDMDVLSTLLAIVIGLALLSALFASFQNRFAGGGKVDLGSWAWTRIAAFSSRVDEYTPEGTAIEVKRRTNVWETEFRERILGVQERGTAGWLIAAEVLGDEVLWNVDFEKSPDGWVSANDLKKVHQGFVASVRAWFLWLSAIFSILGAGIGLYSWKRWVLLTTIHKKQMEMLEKKLTETDVANKNERWQHVEELAASDNPGDWRVAIIEADIMLNELVSSMGYDGDTLGDKLKRIEKSDFTTLDLAWEAHKVRNRIAHSGSDFILTAREAKRVVGLYREVLQEFDYV
ncbi:MAG: hypothetical protein AMXMBFR44_6660 [Candidatus Campbellbacteria bacterium]